MPEGRVLTLSLPQVLDQIGLNGVYCEGGARFAESLLEEGLADYLFAINLPGNFLVHGPFLPPFPKSFAFVIPSN